MEDRRNNFGRIEGKIRTKKLNARVDLTAMVSVSFLLIVFFMLTSYMSRPLAMDLGGDDGGCCDCAPYYEGDNRSLTLLLGDNDRLVGYFGNFEMPLEGPKELEYGKNGLRKELLRMINALPSKHKKHLLVYIKPSKASTYQNLVEVLDEMTVNGLSYAVTDITYEEMQLLAGK
ncbi:biopolymer transporter ExbD [Flavobacterium amniphilum]|uniref:ExbD/TolR family protein n=1 Tax=Flavobacterium amniphilum TaxID=1834035 RepID=UPI002029C18C|nr:biopolymer transporter ExbD [Flavobacterium amniphilum]MCL9804418.1 biopolymer transporter ExbD [Flavobacterium amniphilum]